MFATSAQTALKPDGLVLATTSNPKMPDESDNDLPVYMKGQPPEKIKNLITPYLKVVVVAKSEIGIFGPTFNFLVLARADSSYPVHQGQAKDYFD